MSLVNAMKHLKLWFIIPLLTATLQMHAQYIDNFNDGDFTANPVWQGNTTKFTITDGKLHLNDTAASGSNLKAYLSTPSVAIDDAEWQCTIQVKTALTSGNYVRYYIAASAAELSNNLQGYFVLVGGKGKKVALYRQNGAYNDTTIIINGANNRLTSTNDNIVRLKITRTAAGKWQLYSQLTHETNFTLEGSTTDNIIKNSSYSGICINYSKTNSTKYFFDDFIVTGNPYIPKHQNIQFGDIVFSEILADPTPSVGLPEAEYVELFNRSDSALTLTGWQLVSGTKRGTINEATIPASGYLLLCATKDTTTLRPFGNTAEVTAFPTLNNAGMLLELRTDDGQTVAWVNYSNQWYGADNFKKEGGWSLECIDVENLASGANNWKPSCDPRGGTPAAPNCVAAANPDNTYPHISGVAYATDTTATIFFTKPMNATTLQNVANYTSAQIIVHTATVNTVQANSVTLRFTPALNDSMVADVKLRNLTCISDLPLAECTIHLARPLEPDSMELIINEILFNPRDGGSDYIELLNASDKTLDLSTVQLVRRKSYDYFDTPIALCTEHRLLMPHGYLLLTESREAVCAQYTCLDTAQVIELTLPPMNDDEGDVAIVRLSGAIIDEMAYSSKMHHPLIRDKEGVSLERINPYAPTQQADNWHSASFECGYGTPGAQNSQFYIPLEQQKHKKHFYLEYDEFTPDNDGFRDQLYLHYTLPESGYILTIGLYTPSGFHVMNLCQNRLLDRSGTITWNGQNAQGVLCDAGIYVLLIQAFHPNGQRIQQKIVCVSTSR